jgi:two-component system response regulator MprA
MGNIILIVEDDLALSGALENKLVAEKFKVLTAKDGHEGLESALKNKPDLILLDLIMPRMNGIEMLRKLREGKWGRTVPVLVLTNDDNPESMHQSLKDNAIDYLIKADWDLENVIKKIKTKLGK